METRETAKSAPSRPAEAEVSPEIAVLLYQRKRLNLNQARQLAKMSLSQFSSLLQSRQQSKN